MKKSLLILTIAAFAVCGCKTSQRVDDTLAHSTFEVSCLGVDHDGSQTLRAFGKGKDKKQAMETAKKNALRAVIFKGITAGSGECNKRPLVTAVNAEQRYESYFNEFFRDGGEYKNYVSSTDEKQNSRIKAANTALENWGIVVRVDRAALRQKLIDDDIIK